MSLHVINLPEPTRSVGPPGEWMGEEVRREGTVGEKEEDTVEASWVDASGGQLKSR